MPGPPQVEQRLEGVPALGLPRTLTSCAGPTCLDLGPEGGLVHRRWETRLVDRGGCRVVLPTMCPGSMWDVA